jgi:hypothetical protein
MFNMNNSAASKRVCELLVSALDDLDIGGNGGFYKGLAVGMAIHSDYWKTSPGSGLPVLGLFDNAIAHAKAKKEQKQ